MFTIGIRDYFLIEVIEFKNLEYEAGGDKDAVFND